MDFRSADLVQVPPRGHAGAHANPLIDGAGYFITWIGSGLTRAASRLGLRMSRKVSHRLQPIDSRSIGDWKSQRKGSKNRQELAEFEAVW